MQKVAQQVTRVEGPNGPVVVTTTCALLDGAPTSRRDEAQTRAQMRRMHQASLRYARAQAVAARSEELWLHRAHSPFA